MEQVHFRRHLMLRGVTLAEDELQMSLAGRGVGFGVVHSNEFLQRVEDTSKVFYRIAERRRDMPFREAGRPKKVVTQDYEMFLSVPRAASFAVTLKLGRPSEQERMPGFVDTAVIVDEFIDLMTLVERDDEQAIEASIPDPTYRTNFVQLAKRLAPDGDAIRVVGFTTMRNGKERSVEVTRTRKEVSTPDAVQAPAQHDRSRVKTVRGILKFADATHGGKGQIKVVDEETGRVQRVKVPEGMMGDIVKPLWESLVVVTGVVEGRYILLKDIEEQ
jgi:hypothetical protein